MISAADVVRKSNGEGKVVDKAIGHQGLGERSDQTDSANMISEVYLLGPQFRSLSRSRLGGP